MATHSSILAWKVPSTEEHGGQQSMGLQRSQTQLSNSTENLHQNSLYQKQQQQKIWISLPFCQSQLGLP